MNELGNRQKRLSVPRVLLLMTAGPALSPRFINYIQMAGICCIIRHQKTPERSFTLAKPNFSFQKRQKEMAKKKKQEEKRQRKLEKSAVQPAENPSQPASEGEAR